MRHFELSIFGIIELSIKLKKKKERKLCPVSTLIAQRAYT